LTREDYYGRSSVIKTRYLDTIVLVVVGFIFMVFMTVGDVV
jgi:hypothetical protein